MSQSHTIGSLDTWQPDDKSFNKHILQAGHDDLMPNDEAVCTVHLVSIGVDLSDVELGGYKLNEDVEVTIGEGDCPMSELLDRVVMTMKQGERCYVNCHVDVHGQRVSELDIDLKSAPKFNISLISFSRSADVTELEADELLDRAEHHKQRGVLLYTSANVDFALRRFLRAVELVRRLDDSGNFPPSAVRDRGHVVLCQSELNLAACRLKTAEYDQVVEHCTAALELEAGNIKGLYRRAQALCQLGRYSEARRDASHAHTLEPGNKAVLTLLSTVAQLSSKEKQIYQKMFST